MPPASSHFAERPVPAPPPMMGSPRAIMARNFSSSFARAILAISACLSFRHPGESRDPGLQEHVARPWPLLGLDPGISPG